MHWLNSIGDGSERHTVIAKSVLPEHIGTAIISKRMGVCKRTVQKRYKRGLDKMVEVSKDFLK